ncbi:GD13450 [Drosophila simulans]|uniref:GD13450 n=1 Tax=Drosophila simulans TaxID=7240 RepID=B4QMJ0_DROSI|nr:GD13450 [Drosophila simulans]
MHGCESGKVIPAARDMIFNHYSGHGQSDGTAEDYAEALDDFLDLRDGRL